MGYFSYNCDHHLSAFTGLPFENKTSDNSKSITMRLESLSYISTSSPTRIFFMSNGSFKSDLRTDELRDVTVLGSMTSTFFSAYVL